MTAEICNDVFYRRNENDRNFNFWKASASEHVPYSFPKIDVKKLYFLFVFYQFFRFPKIVGQGPKIKACTKISA
jgi:hypothetical protein